MQFMEHICVKASDVIICTVKGVGRVTDKFNALTPCESFCARIILYARNT